MSELSTTLSTIDYAYNSHETIPNLNHKIILLPTYQQRLLLVLLVNI